MVQNVKLTKQLTLVKIKVLYFLNWSPVWFRIYLQTCADAGQIKRRHLTNTYAILFRLQIIAKSRWNFITILLLCIIIMYCPLIGKIIITVDILNLLFQNKRKRINHRHNSSCLLLFFEQLM